MGRAVEPNLPISGNPHEHRTLLERSGASGALVSSKASGSPGSTAVQGSVTAQLDTLVVGTVTCLLFLLPLQGLVRFS